ncbi:N-6 DNA methylase [Actinospica sp. MGRD01-02]|uniref:site-specific DNA-methyltransferase (adenine-specific) n=1 Tax=Actinospica acidithermotolerans TaxID=2828514 RepID=A0A941IM28_9ACTN|nr:type ISP restriction/modification enzyme [Actinospica acidithermotolerans]MBR7828176.1 N-6 DNA methylase [Actinospica acidithermotolerans]
MDLQARPDYAVDVAGATVGYIEIKRPGKGACPDAFTGHDARQWAKLRLLPNVLYTDGNEWAVYRSGLLVGTIAQLNAHVARAGSRLAPVDDAFARVITDFLCWRPQPPRSISQLVRAVAGLCQLLRSEVRTALALEGAGHRSPLFSLLAQDWRNLLFPDASDASFADQFAQTVTFALLLARVEGIAFDGEDLGSIAKKLGKKHSVMGKALAVLTDDPDGGLQVTLETLLYVIGAVDWDRLDENSNAAYLLLYDQFLAVYDAELRKKTGSYYTPDPVVAFMVRFTDQILKHRLQQSEGFASPDVVVVDPAMGTGTFLAHVIEHAAATVAKAEGQGAVGPHVRELAMRRLVGFERQIGPYAVAEMRLHEALRHHGSEAPDRGMRIYVADTLDDPYVEQTELGRTYEPIARCRRAANRLKREEPVMVIIGNPPHDKASRGAGKWVEHGSDGTGRIPLDAFRAAGNGRYEYVLSNLHVYFWRWATWKVFDHHPTSPTGIVAFISPSAHLTSRGFAGMREYLRRTADEGWIIDLSPEGHQPDVATRIFPGVQQPLSIGIFARYGPPTSDRPARLHYTAVTGHRDHKHRRLTELALDSPCWAECPTAWHSAFLPEDDTEWNNSPALSDLYPWNSRGVTPGRTWVRSPDRQTLQDRWNTLLAADGDRRRELFIEARDRKLDTVVEPLPGIPPHHGPLSRESGPPPAPVRVAFRSFDRQWLIPDNRVLTVPRPDLWRARGTHQMFITEQNAHPITEGPGLTFSAHIPDMDHYNGRSGRVLPLYRDAQATRPNLAPGLLIHLSERLGIQLTAHDMLAYIAATVAHPGYTRRFQEQLKVPGIRIPLSANPALWHEAIAIGSEVLWLHTYGERYADPDSGRPAGIPWLPADERPKVEATIPDSQQDMPQTIAYTAETLSLCVGSGRISPVSPQAWAYQVSGMPIIKKWFGYRCKTPAGRTSSQLDAINPPTWSPAFTTELLALLNVLERLVRIEPDQDQLLERVCGETLISTHELEQAGVLPAPPSSSKPFKEYGDTLFDLPG